MTTAILCCHHKSSYTMSHCLISLYALFLTKLHRGSRDVLHDKSAAPLLPQNHDSCHHPVPIPPPRRRNSGPRPRTHCFVIASPTFLSSDRHVPAAITSRDNRFVFKYLVSLHEYRKGFNAGLERQLGEQTDIEWTPPSVMCVFLCSKQEACA